MKGQNRRDFLKLAGTGMMTVPFLSDFKYGLNPVTKELNCSKGNTLLPEPDLTFNIKDFGAVGNGQVKNTTAIQQAIDRCSVLGGGRIIVPKGEFLTGAVALRSNTTLYLEKGAVLSGSSSFDDYPVFQVRWEGKWIQGYAALIYAINEVNISIKGDGVIKGNHALGGRPSKEQPLRHPALIEPIGCKQVKLEGFTTDYHLMWSIHPTYCEDITIRDLTIRSTGGNGDGIDIDSCKKVLIDHCDISSGDDCIAIKSGRGMEGYELARPTENVHIKNCTFSDAIFACIGIGSETSGGIQNVHIEQCHFKQAGTTALYIKSHVGRGAYIKNIRANNLKVSGMGRGFLRLNLMGSGIRDPFPVPGVKGIPDVSHFSFTDIQVQGVPTLVEAVSVHPLKPLDHFTLSNVSGTCKKGIFMANIHNAHIENIDVFGYSGSLLHVKNVMGMGIRNASELTYLPEVPDPVKPYDPPYQLH